MADKDVQRVVTTCAAPLVVSARDAAITLLALRSCDMMETINGFYKAECVGTTIFHDGPYKTIADVEYATAGWVDWCNHRRLHGGLGM